MNVCRIILLLMVMPLFLLMGQAPVSSFGKAESSIEMRYLLNQFSNEKDTALRALQGQFDVSAYRLSIELIPEQQLIRGSVVVEAYSKRDGLQTIVLDINSNMQVDSVLA